MEIIKEKRAQWNFDLFFLATLCSDSIEVFEKEFGNQVVYIHRDRKTMETIRQDKMIFEKMIRNYMKI